MFSSIKKDIFKFEEIKQVPIQKMIVCALSTTLPLIIGFKNQHLFDSVLASLLGLALTLNDHHGQFKTRAYHLLVTAFALLSGYFLGSGVNALGDFKYLIFFLLAFILGKIKNFNIEIERIFLFFLLNITTISGLNLSLPSIQMASIYVFFNFVFYIALVKLTDFLALNFETKEYQPKWITFKSALSNKSSTKFAFFLALMTLIGYLFAYWLNLNRAYWIVGTILIVMLPDPRATYLKATQRFLGTVLGIILALICIYFSTNLFLTLIVLIFISNLLMPLLITINFTLGNICISCFVLCLLEMTKSIQENALSLSLLRIEDIFIGGILGGIGIYLSHQTFFKLKKTEQNLKI